MTIRTTPRADRQIASIHAWWAANRGDAPNLFLDELAATFALVESAPMIGSAWPARRTKGVRRIAMRSTRYHVYFVVERDVTWIVTVWSAVRGRGPRL